MSETEKNEWQQREVGALWKRVSKSGQKYLSGHVSVEDELGTEKRMKVICFSNKFKSESASVSSSKGLSGAGKGKGKKIKFT